jgi:biopolymer transport protein ExbD
VKLRNRERRKPLIPINAMSDIAFLLLIFIMLISLINYRFEVPIDYPEARSQENTQADANLEIWIDRAGRIFCRGAELSLGQIEGIVADAAAGNPSIRIHILADRGTPYRNVNGVVEILKLIQHRVVSFVVKDAN